MTDPLTVLLDEADARYRGHISTHYKGCYLDHVGCFAVAVRDVFEQAHTPTDDERESIRRAVVDGTEAYAEAQIPGTYVSEYIADAVQAAGFRRTAAPEPQGEPTADPKPTDEAWDRTLDDYREAGWEGDDPADWERMFWEAGFRQGVRALRAAHETKGEGR